MNASTVHSLWTLRKYGETVFTACCLSAPTRHSQGLPLHHTPRAHWWSLFPLGSIDYTGTCPYCLPLPSFPPPNLFSLPQCSALYSTRPKMKLSKEPKQAPYKKEKDTLPKTKFKCTGLVGNIFRGRRGTVLSWLLLPGPQISQSVWRRKNKEVSSEDYAAYAFPLQRAQTFALLSHLFSPNFWDAEKGKYNY